MNKSVKIFIAPTWYKIGVHGNLYRYNDFEWVVSNKTGYEKNVIIEAILQGPPKTSEDFQDI